MTQYTVDRVYDADTFYLEEREQSHRSLSIGAPELQVSQTIDGEKVEEPNAAGIEAARRMKALVPEGSKVNVEAAGYGPFGRIVGTSTVDKNGEPLDYRLMALDQEAAKYEQKYRTGTDEDKAGLALFTSTAFPHKIGEKVAELSEEEYVDIGNKRVLLAEAINAQSEDPSEENQAKVDALAVELYSDPDKVKRWHFMNHPASVRTDDGEFEMVAGNWMSDYRQVLRYNARMAHKTGDVYARPGEGPLDSEDTDLVDAYRGKYGTFQNMINISELSNARQFQELDVTVSLEEKLKGVKPEHHALVLAEPTNQAALKMREQILESYKNDAIIDQAPWWKALPAMGWVMLTDPLTVAGGPAVKGATTAAAHTAKTLTIKAMGTKSADVVLRSKSPEYASAVAGWVAGSGVGSSIAYAPNLAGSPTATLRGYALDVAADTAFGAAFGGGAVLNRAFAGTKLGDAIRLQNRKVIDANYDAAQAYFRRVASKTNRAMAEVKSLGKRKKENQEAFWAKYEEVKAEARTVVQEEAPTIAREVKSVGEEELNRTLKELNPDAHKVELEDIAADINATLETADEAIRKEALKRLKEEDILIGDELVDETRELFTPDVLAQLSDKEKFKVAKILNIDLATVESPASVRMRQFKESGEEAALMEALKSPTLTGILGQTMGRIAKDMATHLMTSNNTGLKYLGAHVTELGRGFGGAKVRSGTGGLIKARTFDQLLTEVLPGYERMINEYAAGMGHGTYQRLRALEDAANHNPLVAKVGREVQLLLNARRMGKTYAAHPSIQKFVDDNWLNFTNRAHDTLVESGIAGFHPGNKLDNYIMRTYTPEVVAKQIETHGEDTIIEAMMIGLRKANPDNPKVPKNNRALRKYAKARLDVIRGITDDLDQFMPSIEGSAKHRVEMDLSASVGDFTLVDLVDSDLAQMAEKYAHRVSGLAGFAKSTNGLINSDIAWDSFKKAALGESQLKTAARDTQLLEDVYNSMMGKPTRGGLPSWARSLRDMAVVTQMGNLGLNEVMEAGVTMNKAVMALARDPQVTAMAYNAARGGKRTKSLMEEVVALTGITDAAEKLERHSAHLDVSNPADTRVGRVLDTTAHYMTGGNFLPHAKRLLAKTTGFNMARRAKHRMAHMSMLMDLGKRFGPIGKGLNTDDRLADLGLFGPDIEAIFKDSAKVSYDQNGLITQLNVENMTKAEKDLLGNGLYRAVSQDVQKHIVGELPPYLNNPLMAVLLQYLSFPLVATNKQLARNAQFADMEALTGVMLNLIVTGTVQDAMIQLGLRKEEDFEINTYKYYSSLGILPDVSMFAAGLETPSLDRVPIYSLLENYKDAGKAGAEYVMSAGEDDLSFNDIKPLLYLNNHATMRAMFNIYQDELGKKVQKDNTLANLRLKANKPLESRKRKHVEFEQIIESPEKTLEVIKQEINSLTDEEMKQIDRELQNVQPIKPLNKLTQDDIAQMSSRERLKVLKAVGVKPPTEEDNG